MGGFVYHRPGSIVCPVFCILLLFHQTPRVPPTGEIIDSLQAVYRAAVARTLAPAAERRLEERRVEQRTTVAMLMEDLLRRDGAGALFTYLRRFLVMEAVLPQDTLWIVPPIPAIAVPGIPLPEDRRFPDDPWRRGEAP